MMAKTNKGSRKALINMELTTFEVPPSGDILVLGKCCAIGPQAAKRMLDTVAPGQFELVQQKDFELVQQKDDLIEGILVKKYLFLRADRDSLIKAIVEESKAIMSEQCMVKIKCDIVLTVRREI